MTCPTSNYVLSRVVPQTKIDPKFKFILLRQKSYKCDFKHPDVRTETKHVPIQNKQNKLQINEEKLRSAVLSQWQTT